MPTCGTPGCSCTPLKRYRRRSSSPSDRGANLTRAKLLYRIEKLGHVVKLEMKEGDVGWSITVDGHTSPVRFGDGSVFLLAGSGAERSFSLRRRGPLSWGATRDIVQSVIKADEVERARRSLDAVARDKARAERQRQGEQDRAVAEATAETQRAFDGLVTELGLRGLVSFRADRHQRAKISFTGALTMDTARAVLLGLREAARGEPKTTAVARAGRTSLPIACTSAECHVDEGQTCAEGEIDPHNCHKAHPALVRSELVRLARDFDTVLSAIRWSDATPDLAEVTSHCDAGGRWLVCEDEQVGLYDKSEAVTVLHRGGRARWAAVHPATVKA